LVLVKSIPYSPVEIKDTPIIKLVFVHLKKIMDKEKTYGRCKEAYLDIAGLWTWYARKIILPQPFFS
jgi:hypothetical protein